MLLIFFLLVLNGDDDANAPPFNGLTANLWIFFLSQNEYIKPNKPRDQIQIGVRTNSSLMEWSKKNPNCELKQVRSISLLFVCDCLWLFLTIVPHVMFAPTL